MTAFVEPSAQFAAQANATGHLAAEAARDPMRFWDEQAGSLTWARGWDDVLDLGEEAPRWFVGGRLSVIASCLDRHVRAGRGDQAALIEVASDGSTNTSTYTDLYSEVRRAAASLRARGVEPGDEVRIGTALPRGRVVIAMLAATYVGAVHTIVDDSEGIDANADDDGLAPSIVDSQHPWCTFVDQTGRYVTHETGPLLTQIVYSTRVLLDVKPCDVVWSSLPATHHLWQLHAVYGTLANGATILAIDDTAQHPAQHPAQHRVAIDIALIDGATARTLPLSTPDVGRSPRLIAATSPISEADWWRLHRDVGAGTSVVTTVWGSTHTGGLIAGPLPGIDACAPACVMGPLAGVVFGGPRDQPTLAVPAPGIRIDVGSRIDSPTDPTLRIS